ncbi:glycoside hydrolase family 9 protein [Duganella sp. Dugasp56]|uniref:glycoside hydrolase family 9 protein n=1 Tax=Duganella sp. Dugasp56 TaxID=3243046 RepID=UPI0039B0243D
MRLPLFQRALGLSIATLAAPLACAAPADVQIKLNQLGFLPASYKLAVVPNVAAQKFAIVEAGSGAEVMAGELGPAALWAPSGETVRQADFSGLVQPGRYQLRVAGLPDSAPFTVAADAYQALNAAAIKYYYLNRAGTALPERHAGVFARAAGHPDTQVLVHDSAASAARPAGTVISSPKGWYDAGDYNKYIVNSGITTYTLLAAYEDFPEFFKAQQLNIPESGNGIPDLLNEALWNLEWMLSMQDPNDGGVYHKLTNKAFDGIAVMPDQATQARYVVQKTTAATLDFAAVMATASRVLAPYDKQLHGMPARMLAASQAAWQWAQAHPKALYLQPKDIATGEYPDQDVSDEFAWAAAELYIATRNDDYYKAMQATKLEATVPSWGDVHGLAWMSLARHRKQLSAAADQALIAGRIDALAGKLLAAWKGSAYGVAMQTGDFVWGSNAVALNQAMMLLQGYQLNGRREYLQAAQSSLDYVLGRNPIDTSFVTGYGIKSPLHPHHRPSEADGIAAPVPGMIVGGPQPGQQDKKDCRQPYPSAMPAKAWLDNVCSYASNEIAINWNAPLVYVSAAIQQLTTPAAGAYKKQQP